MNLWSLGAHAKGKCKPSIRIDGLSARDNQPRSGAHRICIFLIIKLDCT